MARNSKTVSRDETVDGGVLVCHPEDSMRVAYERTLGESGFSTRSAGSLEALPDLSETDIRAVVLSPETPGVSAAELHGGLEGTHARVALLAPFGRDTPSIESLPDRVDECLSEPVPDDRLVETVANLLGRASYDERLRLCFDLAQRLATAEADPEVSETDVRRLRERLRRLRAELGDPEDGIGAVDRFAVAAESDS